MKTIQHKKLYKIACKIDNESYVLTNLDFPNNSNGLNSVHIAFYKDHPSVSARCFINLNDLYNKFLNIKNKPPIDVSIKSEGIGIADLEIKNQILNSLFIIESHTKIIDKPIPLQYLKRRIKEALLLEKVSEQIKSLSRNDINKILKAVPDKFKDIGLK